MKTILIFYISSLLIPVYGQKLKQGIQGQVFWISGNQMPGPGKEVAPQLGVEREVCIYELTYLKDCKQEDGFFISVPAKLVHTVHSNPDGTFKVKLPPGNYSVFVREPKGLFANLFDKDNSINPVVVKERQYSWITIAIDYQTAY